MDRAALTVAAGELNQLEDSDLVAVCLEGSQAAWETLVVRYQRLIYSIPVKARLSQDDAADIFQAVCMKLYQKLSTLRDHQKLSSWLITTTTRECWRVSNRNRREPSFGASEGEADEMNEIPDARPAPGAEREALEQQHAVRRGIESLSERCRDLLTMLFYEKDELSYAEIARRMGMPLPSVGPTRARCLEKLKKTLIGKV